jgi:hypothetical protein
MAVSCLGRRLHPIPAAEACERRSNQSWRRSPILKATVPRRICNVADFPERRPLCHLTEKAALDPHAMGLRDVL